MMKRIVDAERCFLFLPNFTNYQPSSGAEPPPPPPPPLRPRCKPLPPLAVSWTLRGRPRLADRRWRRRRVGGAAGDIGLVVKLEECEFLSDGRVMMQARCTDRARVKNSWCAAAQPLARRKVWFGHHKVWFDLIWMQPLS